MATYTNAYDKLYNNMKNTFTTINDGIECTVGEFMLRRAKEKRGSGNLPVAVSKETAIATIYTYVSDKLTIKNQPVKDRTIKAFPFRSCAAALLCAVVTCTAIFSYGSFVTPDFDGAAYVAENEVIDEIEESAQLSTAE